MPELSALEGRFVRLLPMEAAHVDALMEAAGGDRSTFGFTPVPSDRAAMTDYVERAVAHRQAGDQVPFVTFSAVHRRIVGTTRFYDLAPWEWPPSGPGSASLQRDDRPDVATIGHTWLDPSAQRSPVNTESKLLMLGHAFEQWGVWAVRIQTDARNVRSRRAIERLGLTLDGIIRAHMPGIDGTVRDSAVFSMVADEWPEHRQRLVDRLAR